MAQEVPLSYEVAAWMREQGFSLTDWTDMAVVADAVSEALGDERRQEVIEHGRFLARALGQALYHLLGAEVGQIDRELFHAFQHASCVELRRPLVGKSIRKCLALAQKHQEKLDRKLSERGKSAWLQMLDLLESFLASPLAGTAREEPA